MDACRFWWPGRPAGSTVRPNPPLSAPFNRASMAMGRHVFLLLLCFCYGVTASEDQTINEESWLRQYGYLPPLDSTDSSNQDLSEAIREMQRSYSLEVTGLMDQQTIAAMKRPRCGIPDKTNVGWSSYVTVGTKWDKYDLTYSIETFPPRIAGEDTSKAIRRAFKVWKDVSPLKFEEIPYDEIHYGRRDPADITINFFSGRHKGHDFESSDLAHANSPKPEGSFVHFNSDKQWSITNKHVDGSYNVFLVAVHELGHSLGLGHSDDTSSIMHKDYKWTDTDNFRLSADDRQGIQDLYGDDNLKREKTPTPPPVKSCPGGWKTFGDRCYYITPGWSSWQHARDYCQSQGADLVVINSPEEQVYIKGLRTEAEGAWRNSWIGLKRKGGIWTWVDGTPLTTSYWHSGRPLAGEDNNCALYYHHTDPGYWHNWLCSLTHPAICEK